MREEKTTTRGSHEAWQQAGGRAHDEAAPSPAPCLVAAVLCRSQENPRQDDTISRMRYAVPGLDRLARAGIQLVEPPWANEIAPWRGCGWRRKACPARGPQGPSSLCSAPGSTAHPQPNPRTTFALSTGRRSLPKRALASTRCDTTAMRSVTGLACAARVWLRRAGTFCISTGAFGPALYPPSRLFATGGSLQGALRHLLHLQLATSNIRSLAGRGRSPQQAEGISVGFDAQVPAPSNPLQRRRLNCWPACWLELPRHAVGSRPVHFSESLSVVG